MRLKLLVILIALCKKDILWAKTRWLHKSQSEEIRVFENVGISIWFKHSEKINRLLDKKMVCFLR